jgi:hypothetical protein
MAYETGTATDHRDLLRRLRAFVTGAALGGQAWSELRWTEDATTQELMLMGPGLAGVDEIFVGIRSDQKVASDTYNWHIQGATGYLPLDAWADQPNASPERHMALWDQPLPYWFIANGRRILVAARVSTRVMLIHLGFILPYATPGQYPYPLLIVGSGSDARWSGVYTNFAPVIHSPGGEWNAGAHLWPVGENVMPSPGDVYPVTRIVVSTDSLGVAEALGEIDGLAHVSGYANATENTVTAGSAAWLVLQDAAQTGIANYTALKLE